MKVNVMTNICPLSNSLPFLPPPLQLSVVQEKSEKRLGCGDVVDRAILQKTSRSISVMFFQTSKRLTGSARRQMSSLQDKARGKVMQLKQGGR